MFAPYFSSAPHRPWVLLEETDHHSSLEISLSAQPMMMSPSRIVQTRAQAQGDLSGGSRRPDSCPQRPSMASPESLARFEKRRATSKAKKRAFYLSYGEERMN